jgi:hypothetical protein
VVHNTVTLTTAVCGCETWSLILREEYMLCEFENRVLRNIFGYKKIEHTEEWRKMNTDKLHDLHSPLNTNSVIKSRRIKRVGHIGKKSNVYRVLGENLKESDHSEELNIDTW